MILITQVFFLTKIRIFIIKLANFYFGEEKRERKKELSGASLTQFPINFKLFDTPIFIIDCRCFFNNIVYIVIVYKRV